MKRYRKRPGVVLLEVCEEYLLAATGDARGHCPYVTQINAPAAKLWRALEGEMDLQELMSAAARKSGAEPKTLLLPALVFLDKMGKAGYLMEEES